MIERFENNKNIIFLLFGSKKNDYYKYSNVIDLRGKTDFLELISIIKNVCKYLILPDSGILSFVYYLSCSFPIKIISLWGDANQGVLKQNVASPNPQLVHIPFLGRNKDINAIDLENIIRSLGDL